MSGISTHVLDVALGCPATGVVVVLTRGVEAGWQECGAGATDLDGRCRSLMADAPVEVGLYRLTFQTGAYFARAGRETLYPEIAILFEVTDGGAGYHIPLLLSPFCFTTYRGS